MDCSATVEAWVVGHSYFECYVDPVGSDDFGPSSKDKVGLGSCYSV